MLIVLLVVLFVLVVYAVRLYKKNLKNRDLYINNQEEESEIDAADAFLKHKYSTISYPGESVTLGLKANTIQPPYQTDVKVKLIPNPSRNNNSRKSIKYTELSDEKAEAIIDDISSGEHSPAGQTQFGRSINAYKDKVTSFITKYRDQHQSSSRNEDAERRIWIADPDLVVDDTKNEHIAISSNPPPDRLPRSDSVNLGVESLGRITFTMYYYPADEYLTLLLISGREMYSCDPHFSIRLPAVSVLIENNPNSEVTSNPDEAPNPEYDQEFTFTIRPQELFDVVLQFIVWDIISNNETRVIGFFRVQLAPYQKALLEGAESGPICREIKSCLNPVRISF